MTFHVMKVILNEYVWILEWGATSCLYLLLMVWVLFIVQIIYALGWCCRLTIFVLFFYLTIFVLFFYVLLFNSMCFISVWNCQAMRWSGYRRAKFLTKSVWVRPLVWVSTRFSVSVRGNWTVCSWKIRMWWGLFTLPSVSIIVQGTVL